MRKSKNVSMLSSTWHSKMNWDDQPIPSGSHAAFASVQMSDEGWGLAIVNREPFLLPLQRCTYNMICSLIVLTEPFQ
jgi:hypothetical protein